MQNAVNWFEIPTIDIARAATFYGKVLGAELRREDFGGLAHAVFPAGDKAVSGALVQDTKRKPGGSGPLLYLNAPALDACLARVAGAGGKVAVAKTDIGPHGHFAIVEDTEGNLVGLHAPPKA